MARDLFAEIEPTQKRDLFAEIESIEQPEAIETENISQFEKPQSANILNVGTGTQSFLESMKKIRAQQDIGSALKPDEPVSDIPEAFREQAKETAEGTTGFLKTGAISTGRGLFKIARAFGIAEPEDETEKLAFLALGEERPITTTIGEAVGETLPFLPVGVGVGALTGPIKKAVAQTALGFIEGGAIAKGEGRKLGDQFRAAGIGGTVAGALELGLPVVGFVASKIVKLTSGNAPTGPLLTKLGKPTPELSSALDAADLTFNDLTDASIEILKDQPELVNPDQAVRKAFLEGQGLTDGAAPTTAQVTRDATKFQAQQEVAKTTGEVRARLEAQQGVLANKFDETIAGTGGQPVTSGSPVADHVLNKSTVLDNEISDLYNIAKERLTDSENVDLSQTFGRLRAMRPSDATMGGPISAIEGEAKRLGLIDPETGVSRLATVDEAELLRKFSNKLFNSVTDFGKKGLRDFRNAVDDDVTKSAGEDIFQQGRQAKAKFEADLSRSKISKFDKKKDSIVRDVLENKVDPERLFEQTILAKKYRGSDIKQLKNYMKTGTKEQVKAGTEAFNDLRAETLEYIKNQSFIGPEDAAGNKNLSRNAIEKTLKRIGDEKLSELFTTAELSFLKDMAKVAKMLEPVRGAQQGAGPSAQAIASLKRRIDKIPALNVFVDLEFSKAGGVLKGKPELKRRQLLPTKRELARQAAITSTVAGTVREEE